MTPTFAELVDSRKQWIAEVLQPWCRQAARRDLLQADMEWADIAGRVDPESTLWTWAWGRFPDLVEEGLSGVNETWQVRVTTRDGRTFTGWPDGRASEKGLLVLVPGEDGPDPESPLSIDDIAAVERVV